MPEIYRPHIREVHYGEVSLFEQFKALGTPYVRQRPNDDWEWYFLARHHGLPTRLLDWTESLLSQIRRRLGVRSGGPRTARYLPDALRDKADSENEHPIAIYPPRVSERIVAQQGVLTLHGHSMVALQELPESATGEIKLARIILDTANLRFLWDDIRVAGIGPIGIFPDLDNVAKHLRWVFQSGT